MKQEMKNILIVGVGGIGSQLIDELVPALTAGAFAERLGGVRVHLMDSDRVEEANLSHQRHEPRMVGRLKVDSLAERLDPFLSPALGIVAHDEDLRRGEQLEGYDLVVVAVDRPAARLLAHAHATEWVDLRCGGDGYMALDDETEARLVTLMTPDDQQPASCQQEGAVENGNIEMGYALAAAHGTQWVIQRLRRMLGEPTRAPPARMYSLTFGELRFPRLEGANGADAPLIPIDVDNPPVPDEVRDGPPRSGAPWSDEEDAALIEELANGLAIPVIADLHGRTEGAIKSRISVLYERSAGMQFTQDVEVLVVVEEEEEEE